ncbi:MAG: deoxyribodipyrimidine photolyase [Deltaproteobacteria bacterium]|nr:deoxyribodipyrimidine photolyase [Deltaproteobacteria bacterium]
MSSKVPAIRVRALNDAPLRPGGSHVLYWMTAARRTRWSFALDHALDRARELGVGLVVLEALRLDHPWASERLHRFVVEGMRDNRAALEATPVRYHPYVETAPGAGRGLLEAWAREAALVVTDDLPAYFLPRMQAAAAERLAVRLEAVDGNGLHPLRATDRIFTTAASFRRHLQKTLPAHIDHAPRAAPLRGLDLPPVTCPPELARRWPAHLPEDGALAALAYPQAVAPAPLRGGARAAARRLEAFLAHRLEAYPEGRNQPEQEAASGLSPYLHFGHLSAHEIFARLMAREDWAPDLLAPRATGSREGWWGASAAAEAFLDQLVTWRELGLNACAHEPGFGTWGSLPAWARQTLDLHAADPRPHAYGPRTLEQAGTHDELWNAAQRQLVREGTIHNYLRMLWGKKILEWSRDPRAALKVMLELNDRYALDGRDPNSLSGILWVLGRYDRAWGPERAIFGKVRYMSSENTARKVRVRAYLARHAAG